MARLRAQQEACFGNVANGVEKLEATRCGTLFCILYVETFLLLTLYAWSGWTIELSRSPAMLFVSDNMLSCFSRMLPYGVPLKAAFTPLLPVASASLIQVASGPKHRLLPAITRLWRQRSDVLPSYERYASQMVDQQNALIVH